MRVDTISLYTKIRMDEFIRVPCLWVFAEVIYRTNFGGVAFILVYGVDT